MANPLYPTDVSLVTNIALELLRQRRLPNPASPRDRKDAWVAAGFVLNLAGGDPDVTPPPLPPGGGIAVAMPGDVTAEEVHGAVAAAFPDGNTAEFYQAASDSLATALEGHVGDEVIAAIRVAPAMFFDAIVAALMKVLLDRLGDSEWVAQMIELLLELIMKRTGGGGPQI